MKYLAAIFTSHDSCKRGEAPIALLLTDDTSEVRKFLDDQGTSGLLGDDAERLENDANGLTGMEWVDVFRDVWIVIRKGDFYIIQPALKIDA